MKKEDIIQAVQAIVDRHLDETYSLVLFGSQARGDASATSDIDIGILGPSPVPWHTYLAIRREVSVIPTLRRIDIVDLMGVREEFREQALREGSTLLRTAQTS